MEWVIGIIGVLLGGAGVAGLAPLLRTKAQNRRDEADAFTIVAGKVQEIAGAALDRMESQLDGVLLREQQCRVELNEARVELNEAHAKIRVLNDDVFNLRAKVDEHLHECG